MPGGGAHLEWASFRGNRPFLLLWCGQAASQLGTSISSAAYALLVLALTGSAAKARLVATVLAATTFVLRVPAGLIADRCRYRPVMLAADGIRAAAVGSIPAAACWWRLSLVQLLVVAVVEGAAGVVFGPAEFGAVRLVVPGAQRRGRGQDAVPQRARRAVRSSRRAASTQYK